MAFRSRVVIGAESIEFSERRSLGVTRARNTARAAMRHPQGPPSTAPAPVLKNDEINKSNFARKPRQDSKLSPELPSSQSSPAEMSLPTRQSRLNEKFITPQAVHSPPYTYGSSKNWGRYGQDEFRLDDIVWATPEDLVNRIRKGDLAPDRSPPAKKWLLTQLNLYGIPYKKSDRAGDLKAALVKASEDGKVRHDGWHLGTFGTWKLPDTDVSALTSRHLLLL